LLLGSGKDPIGQLGRGLAPEHLAKRLIDQAIAELVLFGVG
jgi:hypothetical protein